MSRRVYLIGTNTEIGKTSLLEAILTQAHREHIAAIPFKPAQSGSMPDPQSDAGRLIAACGIQGLHPDLVAPHRYQEDKAPGVIDSPEHFLSQGLTAKLEAIQRAQEALQILEDTHKPSWSFCEGAGGLHVPMPGGTWQTQWVKALSQSCIIVAPTGLGTINHTLLTIRAVQNLGLPLLGIAWTGAQPGNPKLAQENMQIVELKSGLPALSRPDGQGSFNLVDELFEIIASRHDRALAENPAVQPA